MMDTNKPIVVGVDGSRFSREALRWALAEGKRRDCAVRALMVADLAPVVAAGRPTTMGMATTLAAQPGQEHLRRLEDTVKAVLGETDDPRLTAEVVRGSAAETLCVASKEAQLLVVGNHGRSGLVEAVVGSVARYCVHHASCPVVVIPAALADPETKTVAEPLTGYEPVSYGPGPLL
jgi:nucleotide-binding universal stress UspA family protein